MYVICISPQNFQFYLTRCQNSKVQDLCLYLTFFVLGHIYVYAIIVGQLWIEMNDYKLNSDVFNLEVRTRGEIPYLCLKQCPCFLSVVIKVNELYIMFRINCLFVSKICLELYVPLKNVSLIWRPILLIRLSQRDISLADSVELAFKFIPARGKLFISIFPLILPLHLVSYGLGISVLLLALLQLDTSFVHSLEPPSPPVPFLLGVNC